jgi:hypothetical protein
VTDFAQLVRAVRDAGFDEGRDSFVVDSAAEEKALLDAVKALEAERDSLRAALRRIRDATHTTAVVLRGIANTALGAK